MDLTTRCPECNTTFAASLEQLQLRKGYIRCINCAHIFDGFEAVVSPGAATPEHRISSTVSGKEPAFTVPAHTVRDDSNAQAGPAFRVGADQISSRPEPSVSLHAEAAAPAPASVVHHSSQASDGHSAQVYVEPRSTASPSAAGQGYHEASGGVAAGSSIARLFWRSLVVLGLIVLLAQLVYVYRAQIANHVDVLRPVLERACEPFQCKIPYAREIDQISIVSSSLRSGTEAAGASTEGQAEDANPAPLLLQLTMRNSYDKPQEWPTLVLDLTDLSGTLVVRKNLPPASYLSDEVREQPFRAASEITVNVPITPQGVQANGYQLDKFFQ